MDYKSFAEHTETYEINGIRYKAIANFVTEQLFIKWPGGFFKGPLSDYDEYDGDMESYVTDKVAGK